MRNEHRIDWVCEQLAQIWENSFPDWRFTQFFNNFLSWLGTDGFYIEDEKLITLIKQFVREKINEQDN